MERSILLAGLAILALATPAAAQSRQITADQIGCKSEEVQDTLVSLAVSGDREAFAKMLLAGIATGNCRKWQIGDTVYIEKSRWTGTSCLRPQGDVECYWTPREAFR